MRDLVVGITVVLSDGTVAKAGGKVIKNVAGYDLGKLFAGSLGTLGLIAQVAVRLHPRPDTDGDRDGLDRRPGRARRRCRGRWPRCRSRPTASTSRWEGGSGALLVRFGGTAAPHQAEGSVARVREAGLDGVESVADDDELWARQREAQRGTAVLKVSGRPTDLAAACRAAEEAGGAARRPRRARPVLDRARWRRAARAHHGRALGAGPARLRAARRAGGGAGGAWTRGAPVPSRARWPSWRASRSASTRPGSSDRAPSWEASEWPGPGLPTGTWEDPQVSAPDVIGVTRREVLPPEQRGWDAQRPPDPDLIRDCVHCGFCLPTCPSYAVFEEEMDSPRGRIVLMRVGHEEGAEISPGDGHALRPAASAAWRASRPARRASSTTG